MPESTHLIWLLAREYEGWAEAGGVKDVVHDMSKALVELGWEVHVVLPFYGFLKERIYSHGAKTWVGTSHHPEFHNLPLECWEIRNNNLIFHFLKSPSFETKQGVYTVTREEENFESPRGKGYSDAMQMNLEFQWATVEFWSQNNCIPRLILANDGHCGFVSAIAKTDPVWAERFQLSQFFLLIHNAGQGYRQEMICSLENAKLLNLPSSLLKSLTWEQTWDPLIFFSSFGKLATVSENYARELVTGENDFYSGSFGRYLRESKVPLMGITNGFDTSRVDPRFIHRSGLPYKFDPLVGDWEGKNSCKTRLTEQLTMMSSNIYGWINDWRRPLYVFQSRLVAQKGVKDLKELIATVVPLNWGVNFLVMGVGERSFEQDLIWLARDFQDGGQFYFINFYDDELANLVFASADFFLMPSMYEPCGLTDLKAQMMGALPIVSNIGGLVKIRDGETGFTYDRTMDRGLFEAFQRSYELQSRRPDIVEIMRRQAFRSCINNYRWVDILRNSYFPWFFQIA